MPENILPPLPVVEGVEFRHSYLPRICVGNDGSILVFFKGKWQKKSANPHKGYPHISVGRNPKKRIPIHKIVGTAFNGPRPSGMVTRHLDGNPFNNRADNLKWGTQKENTQDRIRHGRNNLGENNPRTPFKNRDVLEIRSLFSGGLGKDQLAAKFNVTVPCIHGIVTRLKWNHI